MQQEAARQHAQPTSVGYGKNNPPVSGMAPQQQSMLPQQQQRMPMQQPMPSQAARMQLPAMNDWGGNRLPGPGTAGASAPGVSVPSPQQPAPVATGLMRNPGGQQGAPRNNIPGLHELLQSLKNPTGNGP